MFDRKNVAMIVAEFLGTYVLTTAILSSSQIGLPFFPAIAAGLTAAVMVLVIGPATGAHINPAVTFGMWTLRKVSTSTAVMFIAAQLLGGYGALRANEYFMDRTLPALADKGWDWRIVLAEALGTLIFTFGFAAAIYRKYEGGQKAAAIGLSLFAGILVASFAAYGALNPAVALGVNSWSVSYVAGPLIGAVVGMNLYALLFTDAKTALSSKKK